MISAIIIDDEKTDRIVLRTMIERHLGDKIKIVDTAESLKSGVELINTLHPDIVFLDIEMPEENGLKIFNYFRNINFSIVFVTAHQEYAIHALRNEALDFILKPIRAEEIFAVFDRFEKKTNSRINQEHIKRLLESLSPYPDSRGKIVLPTFTGYRFEKINSIMYCEADRNYSKIFTFYGEQILISKSISYLEEILPSDTFIRIHKSYVVNLNFVKSYNHSDGYHIVLDDGRTLDIASRRHIDVIKKLKNKS